MCWKVLQSVHLLSSFDNSIILQIPKNEKYLVKEKAGTFIPTFSCNTQCSERTENKTITKVELPKSVQSIKNYAFLCCEGLEEIKLSEGLEAIGNNAFANCNEIKKADLPDSVKALGADTFYDCDSLEEVVLGKGLEKVGDDTFRYCEKLTKLTVKGNIESINSSVFYNTTIKELLVGKGVSSLKETLYGLEALEKIEVEEGNESYISEEGVLYNKEKTTLIRYPQSKSDQTEYKVPEGVKIIGENAFRENKVLSELWV